MKDLNMTDNPELSLPELTFPPAIDSTMLSCFDACPTKFLYEFVLRKAPVGLSIHLHAGGALASALETIRRLFYRDKLPVEQCLKVAFREYVLNWGDFDVPDGQYKDFVNMWAAIEAYLKEYPLATDYFQPYMMANGEPAVEFKFAIPTDIKHPVSGDPILFAGRADLLAQNEPSSCYVLDEKTTKAMGSSWQYQWDMRGQFYGYTFAARRMGHPCAGALVRGIAIQQTQFQFQEKVLFFTDTQLERWWKNANKKILRMVEMFERAKSSTTHNGIHSSFDMSFGDACSSYGGCQYTDLCVKDEPWKLYNDYETRVWDPLDPNPTKNSENRLKGMEEISFRDFMGV